MSKINENINSQTVPLLVTLQQLALFISYIIIFATLFCRRYKRVCWGFIISTSFQRSL